MYSPAPMRNPTAATAPAPAFASQSTEGERRSLNSELWHACAGPLVSLPTVGTPVVYFPQGHTEQVAASTQQEADGHALNYPNPNLLSCLTCHLHNVTLHADMETDEVYAQMTLQPVNGLLEKDALVQDPAKLNRQPTDFFCKTLTASDTSTHGGFSIPRKSAEKVFPPLDYTQMPPAQELSARDLHDQEWRFRHIYRGQPKRHLLTTGWSNFVSAKKLQAGDAVLFIRDEKGQLLLGIRRANRQQAQMPSSVLSSVSMHIGVIGAAAHAAATSSRFTIFYNPRASPSEFVIPFAKYQKAVHEVQLSVGMRFRMVFETEESGMRRHIGTITGIGDLDPVRWPNSKWRALKVNWDESTAGERQPRVSAWEIEPLTTPFIVCPPLPNIPARSKRPRPPRGQEHTLNGEEEDFDGVLKRSPPWLRGEDGDSEVVQGLSFRALGVDHWVTRMQRVEPVAASLSDNYKALAASALQDTIAASKQMIPRQPQQVLQSPQLHFRTQHPMSLQSQHLQHQQQQHHHQQPAQQQHQGMPQLSDATVPLLQLSSSRPQSPISLPQMRAPVGFSNSDLQLSSAPTSSSPFPLSSMMGRIQAGSMVTGDDSAQYASILRSNQSPLQQQPGVMSASSLVPRDGQVNPSWYASMREHSQGEAQVMNSRLSRGDAASGGVGPFSMSPGEPSSQAGLSTLPVVGPSSFGFRESPQDQEHVQPDPRSHLLFGVSIESPLLVSNPGSSLPPRVFGKEAQHRLPSGVILPGNYASNSGSDNGLLGSAGMDENSLLQRNSNWPQIQTPVRTFTKVVKLGSVGRSLDITRFSGYAELQSELERMFGIEGQLQDSARSGWQLVFVDHEGDVLLVGDDPWEEFVSYVRYIRILSPPEVQQMSQEGLDLLTHVPRQTSSSSEDCVGRQDSRNQTSNSPAPPAAGCMER